MIKTEVLKYLIQQSPGRSELELAKAIHGDGGYQQQINQDLTLLLGRGEVQRCGENPFRYYPA